jgi:hypothetical protein
MKIWPRRSGRVAEHQIGRLERFESGASDQLVKMSVWLTASLLAINSGGALAALNVAEHFEFPTPAALLFGIGILLALLSGVAIQGFQSKAAQPLEELLLYWRGVQISGVEDIERAVELAKPLITLNRFAFIPPTIGWFSGLAFFVGAIALGLHVEHRGKAVVDRCLELQNDMLSLKPRRADSRELFIALKCDPTRL